MTTGFRESPRAGAPSLDDSLAERPCSQSSGRDRGRDTMFVRLLALVALSRTAAGHVGSVEETDCEDLSGNLAVACWKQRLQQSEATNQHLRRVLDEASGRVVGAATAEDAATPAGAQRLPLLFLNSQDVRDTTPDKPILPQQEDDTSLLTATHPHPGPTPYANASWALYNWIDACPSDPSDEGIGCKLVGRSDLYTCWRSCAQSSTCFAWALNKSTSECAHRLDRAWHPNTTSWNSEHMFSACLLGAVPGCTPVGPNSAEQPHRPSMIWRVSNPLTRLHDKRPPPFDYSLCTLIAAPCVAGAFKVLDSPDTYEVFLAQTTFGKVHAPKDLTILRYLTTDFVTWSEPQPVYVLPGGGGGENSSDFVLVKSMARDDASGTYLVACWGGQLFGGIGFLQGNGTQFSLLSSHPFKDKDDINVVYDEKAKQWVDIQIHSITAKLQYCDNMGSGATRWPTARFSADGVHWSGDMRPKAPDYYLDPPELQFYRLRAFYLGSSGRFVAHSLNYAPSNMLVSQVPSYGRMPIAQKACKGACPSTAGYDSAKPVCIHGPHMYEELWMPPPSDLARDVMWYERPFRQSKFAPHDASLMAQPVVYNDTHVFVDDGQVLGVPLYRVAGLYAPANGVFTTKSFAMPTKLYINADVHWEGYELGDENRTCDEGCAAYLMAALHSIGPNGTTSVIAGFEAERCIILNADGLRIPLEWKNSHDTTGASLAGKEVALRIYFREAKIYAVDGIY